MNTGSNTKSNTKSQTKMNTAIIRENGGAWKIINTKKTPKKPKKPKSFMGGGATHEMFVIAVKV